MKVKSWKLWSVAAVFGMALVVVLIRASAEQPPPQKQVRRIESITLNPATCKLKWTVTMGEVHNSEYVAKGKSMEYEIDFHAAEMEHDGVRFKFSEDEAANVHKVMVAISRYTAESVEWFEQQGQPVTRAGR